MAFTLLTLLCFHIMVMIYGTSASTNSSWEHQIRKFLLEDYDRKVRPVFRGKRVVEVAFAMKVSRLVKVDNKEQLLTLDSWVLQQWQNEFLAWNASEFGDKEQVHFSPEEIWVPDIALYNNGDDEINLAGGVSKFVTDVSVSNEGKCLWAGPATFKVNCELTIRKWPFDSQICELAFGSYSYGEHLLKLKIFQARTALTGRFVTSGDWEIDEINPRLDETDNGDCCPFNFSQVVYTISMRRKPLYFVFYLTIPSVLLMVLALTSFFIPAESGERIGFVTTVLLAMTVFLLMIPSFVPETSKNVPILGLNIQITMIIITLVLFANVFVLTIYYLDGTPPAWVRRIYNCFRRNKRRNVQKIHVGNTYDSNSRGVSAASVAAIALSDPHSRPGTPPLIDKGEELTWQKVSIKLDHFFFVFFVLVASIAYAVTYTH